MSLEKWQIVSRIVFYSCMAIPIVYTFIIGQAVGTEATISAITQNDAYKWPVVPAFIGLVFGGFLSHCFFPVYFRQ